MSRRTLLIGTPDGAFTVQVNGGQPTVQPLGLENVGGLRCPVVVDCRNPRVLFAGTGSQGVMRSDDAGQSWRPVNSGLSRPEVWWLEQHPVTGELWAGTSPAAIFTSDDGGEHWRECEQLQRLP